MSCYVSMTSSFYTTDWISDPFLRVSPVIGKVITRNISLLRFILPNWIPNALPVRTLDEENGNHRCLYIMTRILIYHQSKSRKFRVREPWYNCYAFVCHTISVVYILHEKESVWTSHWISFSRKSPYILYCRLFACFS